MLNSNALVLATSQILLVLCADDAVLARSLVGLCRLLEAFQNYCLVGLVVNWGKYLVTSGTHKKLGECESHPLSPSVSPPFYHPLSLYFPSLVCAVCTGKRLYQAQAHNSSLYCFVLGGRGSSKCNTEFCTVCPGRRQN